MNMLKTVAVSSLILSVPAATLPSRAAAQEGQSVRVVVDNHAFWDMHVYVLEGGFRRSLGMATGLSNTSFEIPRSLADGDVQLIADPVGSRAGFVSHVLFPWPGDQLNLTLENYIGLSTVTVSDQPSVEEDEKEGHLNDQVKARGRMTPASI